MPPFFVTKMQNFTKNENIVPNPGWNCLDKNNHVLYHNLIV
jgi:hypothetical protein